MEELDTAWEVIRGPGKEARVAVPRISVLIPTRGRPQALLKSIASLLENAADPSSIEILLGIDVDDIESIEALPHVQADTSAVVIPRRGHHRLHEYFNRLAGIATGDWTLAWSDDALMQTKNWDDLIAALPPCIGWPEHNHPANWDNIAFPIVPRLWIELVGHYSLDWAVDGWWQYVGRYSDTIKPVPIYILHDRADLTGNNDDTTFAERTIHSTAFWSDAIQTQIRDDAEQIRDWLTRQQRVEPPERSSDVLAIVPSRSRPDHSIAFAEAFFAHSTRSDLLFALDEDDPELPRYTSIPGARFEVNPRLRPVGTLNLVANKYANQYAYLAYLSDDHRIHTPGWDQLLVEAIENLPAGIAYGNDPELSEELPTAVLLKADIVRTLEFMAPSGLIHRYKEHFWHDLGQALGSLRYRADVVIEHLHLSTGTAEDDAGDPKTFDCILFFDEVDLVEIRLHELADVVDYHVIVEATMTLSGRPRELCFNLGDARWDSFREKIIYVPVHDMPSEGGDWNREYFQRNAILRALDGLSIVGNTVCSREDLVLLSDADEIPRASAVRRFQEQSDHSIAKFEMSYFNYHVNQRGYFPSASSELEPSWVHWYGTVAARRSTFETPQQLREMRQPAPGDLVIPDGGWHFSWLGGIEKIQLKFASFAHQEFDSPQTYDSARIAAAIAQGRDHLPNEDRWRFKVVPLDDHFPAYLVQNQDRFRDLIAPANGEPLDSRPVYSQGGE
jgi:beta-1,4-mannosyl-glycoprotein beta-1,4-N-acetylglucosaminyltransferase